MSKVETVQLIEGEFSNEEAKEILMNIFSTKMRFHEIKNFSSNERFGKPCETAEKRIPALKKEVEKILLILSEAEKNKKGLSINSEIRISIMD